MSRIRIGTLVALGSLRAGLFSEFSFLFGLPSYPESGPRLPSPISLSCTLFSDVSYAGRLLSYLPPSRDETRALIFLRLFDERTSRTFIYHDSDPVT